MRRSPENAYNYQENKRKQNPESWNDPSSSPQLTQWVGSIEVQLHEQKSVILNNWTYLTNCSSNGEKWREINEIHHLISNPSYGEQHCNCKAVRKLPIQLEFGHAFSNLYSIQNREPNMIILPAEETKMSHTKLDKKT